MAFEVLLRIGGARLFVCVYVQAHIHLFVCVCVCVCTSVLITETSNNIVKYTATNLFFKNLRS